MIQQNMFFKDSVKQVTKIVVVLFSNMLCFMSCKYHYICSHRYTAYFYYCNIYKLYFFNHANIQATYIN